mmetsp:Transcript_67097/g.188992  ORF Transcript_67097/g.188992 Transcript_67097/m.188992 type:complete len:213 (-) Transcript_67097:70-708(-)
MLRCSQGARRPHAQELRPEGVRERGAAPEAVGPPRRGLAARRLRAPPDGRELLGVQQGPGEVRPQPGRPGRLPPLPLPSERAVPVLRARPPADVAAHGRGRVHLHRRVPPELQRLLEVDAVLVAAGAELDGAPEQAEALLQDGARRPRVGDPGVVDEAFPAAWLRHGRGERSRAGRSSPVRVLGRDTVSMLQHAANSMEGATLPRQGALGLV